MLAPARLPDVPLDEMTPEIRRRAKAINFGVIYGISAFGLSNNLRIPQAEAKAFIELFWAKRDPNLETPVNEFRQEFNMRVEAADAKRMSPDPHRRW